MLLRGMRTERTFLRHGSGRVRGNTVQCSSVTLVKGGCAFQLSMGRGHRCVLGCDLLDAWLYSSLVKLGRLKFKVPELQEVRFGKIAKPEDIPWVVK